MAGKFGNAMSFLGKAALSQMTGRDILGEELQERIDAAKAAITGTSDLHQQVMESVSNTLEHLNEFIDGCNEMGIRFEEQFKVEDSIEFLEQLRKEFWAEAQKSSDIFKLNRNYAELLQVTENSLIPKAEIYATKCQALIHNLRAPAFVSEVQEKIEKIGDEINFISSSEKVASYRNAKEINRQAEVAFAIIDKLDKDIRELHDIYDPFEEYGLEKWLDEFKSKVSKLESEYKKFNLVSQGSNSLENQGSDIQNPIEKIKSLGELLEMGLISKKDFEEKKAKLLEEI